ncbi:arsenate reductase family protein [Undibacterium rugosum]|uniref:Arsenate reductase n=1 Tax=Undibacterium rugosum TaxID=2762291 RepID=A0A923L023_9BURK|nr:arsenate reductase family protein [Undibacterium rugosum]MBC3937025.1 arsenate reductase family protein [Undibacterium rugosum]MBR7780289.1 arsenate reductase family protein [Undibacterium rugosum]
MPITIFHNPLCKVSRDTLALIRKNGFEPSIIDYLTYPPSKEVLRSLIVFMGTDARHILQTDNTSAGVLNLEDTTLSEDDLITFMVKNPALIKRPIVVTSLGVRLCNPADIVVEILPQRSNCVLKN